MLLLKQKRIANAKPHRYIDYEVNLDKLRNLRMERQRKLGEVDPTILKKNKKMNFKSGGKRCNDIAMLYIFRKDTMMPDVIVVPPSSLKSMREYAMKLMQSGLRMTDVATKLVLEQAQSATGIKYSKLAMKFSRKLTDDERGRMGEVSAILTKTASSASVSAADLNS